MHRRHHLTLGLVGLMLLVGVGQSWGGPPNHDVSDAVGNTAGGTDALLHTTTGIYNTAFGDNALTSNTIGANNTAVGNNALHQNISGNFNLALGYRAGFPLTSGDHNIYLGSPAGAAIEFNTMRLGCAPPLCPFGAGPQTSTFIAGIAGVTVANSAPVLIDTRTGQLGVMASSLRYKRDIQPMGAHSHKLLQLRPVIFRYTQDPQGERQYGLIAEEVAKVYPELVTRNAQGQVEAIRYQELTPMLLNEVQHQQQTLSAQQRQLGAQQRQLGAQTREIAELKAQNVRLQRQLQERDAALAARLERLEAAAARAATLASR